MPYNDDDDMNMIHCKSRLASILHYPTKNQQNMAETLELKYMSERVN